MADDTTPKRAPKRSPQRSDEQARPAEPAEPVGSPQAPWPWLEDPAQEDPELAALSARQEPQSILRPILMILVLVLGASIIMDRKEELAYFISASTPVDLGQITQHPVKRAQDPSWRPTLPHNRYVKLEGIPSRRTINKKHRFMKLVGDDIYVEQRRDRDGKSELEKITEEANKKPGAERDRDYFVGQGRLLHFAAMPARYQGLRTYYGRHYNTTFCVDVDARARQKIVSDRQDLVRRNWRARYDAASPEERQAEALTPEPTAEQLREVVHSEPVCVDAYLIQADVSPRDHWWYVALCALIAAFMVVDLVLLARWIARFLRPRDL